MYLLNRNATMSTRHQKKKPTLVPKHLTKKGNMKLLVTVQPEPVL